ncbi:unnamed protein product [Ceratitis capitata]|uniref:(Mediterranean fruit fly) hypothetical protein n=1 Tax=Ceratitis capitata TaxID=7213 RepID=A0A811UP29_CERCA|nr:unnamed protein product [Ceratitis capitata]
MSICSLRGLNVRFCRQAYILAHVRTGVVPMPGRTKLRLSLCECNNQQTNNRRGYAINTAGVTTQIELTKLKPSILAAITPLRSSHNNLYQMSAGLKGCIKNAELLQANDCNISKRKKVTCDKKPCEDDGADGSKKGAGGSRGSIMGDDEAKKKTRMLMALLAALGLGGLLLWLQTRRKQKDGESTDCGPTSGLPATVPATSAELPKHVPYLLIGGGTASFSAFRAIKSNDPRAKVLMITNEFRKPYMRPPLSKELWYSAEKGEVTKDYRFKQWTGAERSLFFEPEEFFVEPSKLMETVNGGIAVAHGFAVKKIDPAKHVATLTDGYEITYDECLIATGCSPKTIDVFNQAPPGVREKVMMYRSPDDFERLKRYADEKKSITIVGNGFTGSELACSLANYAKDKKVKIYQIFPESGNMSKVLPSYLSKWTTAKVETMGVCVMPETYVKEAQRDDSVLKLALSNGKSLLTDVVVVCVGCEPNTNIALTSAWRSIGIWVVL